jgi:hypothetical protein
MRGLRNNPRTLAFLFALMLANQVRPEGLGANIESSADSRAFRFWSPVSVRTMSASQINLAWQQAARNGFGIERATDQNGRPGVWVRIAFLGPSVRSFEDKGLAPNQTYWYRLRVLDQFQPGRPESTTTLPLGPSEPTALAVSSAQINLHWKADAHGQAGFKIQRALDHNGNPGTWKEIAQIGAAKTSYSDRGLSPDTLYWFRVCAFNSGGSSGFSKSIKAATPPQPCDLSIAKWGTLFGTQPAMNSQVKAISAGSDFAFALMGDGTVTAFGTNYFGPIAPPSDLAEVSGISAGAAHGLALKSNATVVGWGNDFAGAATPPTNLTGVVAIAAGAVHSLALKSDGTVIAWGDKTYGAATPPTNLTDVIAIAAGVVHSLALKSDGTVVGWGDNTSGEAVPPTNLIDVVAIAAGSSSSHSMALKADGTVVAWGFNQYGQATPPPNLTGVIAISAGARHSLALKSDGTIVSWGDNSYGQAIPRGFTGRVSAISAGGGYSLALATAPSAPDFRFATVESADKINLVWRDNSSNETGFRIERARDNGHHAPGSWSVIATVGANIKKYGDTMVAAHNTYWYRLQSFDQCGDSAFNPPFSIKVSAPPAPDAFAASLGETNRAELSWQENTNGVAGYEIERARDVSGKPGTWQVISKVKATNDFSINFTDPPVAENNTYSFNFTDSTVAANNIYWYRVRAFNGIGFSSYSSRAAVACLPPAAPPLSGYAFADQGRLYWYAYSDTVQGYRVERALDHSGSPGDWQEIATLGKSETSYTNAGLVLGQTYWYRLQGFNWAGSSPYSEISLGPQPLRAPSPVTASVGATNQIKLSWFMSFMDQQGFKVERALDADGAPGAWSEIANLSLPETNYGLYADSGVAAYTTNWYRVRAYNVFGDSPYSDAVSVRIVPPATPFLSASTTFVTNVDLFIRAHSGGSGGFKVERAPDAGGNPGAWAEIDTFRLGDISVTYYTDRTLYPNTTAWYRVRAFNWVGESPLSDPIRVSLSPPPAPILDSLLIGETNQILLRWRSAGLAQGFRVQRAPDENGSPGTWTEVANGAFTSYSYPVFYYTDSLPTNMATNITYWYRVLSINIVGDSPPSFPLSIIVGPPPMPDNFTVTTDHNRATLSWTIDFFSYGPVFQFTVERALDARGTPGPWFELADPNGNDGFCIDSGLTVNRTYWYRVRTYNWAGASPYTVPLSVTIAPGIAGPPDGAAVPVDSASAEYLYDFGTTIAPVTGQPAGVALTHRLSRTDVSSVQIVSISSTSGLRITWSTWGGSTNFVQAASSLKGGFSNISPALIIPGGGAAAATFLDNDISTNAPVRLYRIKNTR